MPWANPRTPPTWPLLAALLAAGSFLFWSAWSVRSNALKLAAEEPAPSTAACRVLGTGVASRDLGVLAADLAWLSAQGPAVIVLEAWMDEAPPQAAGRLAQELRTRLEALPAGRKEAALLALSETAAGQGPAERLAQTLAQGPPVLLGVRAVPGPSAALFPALRKLGFSVTLQGTRQALAPSMAELTPWPQWVSSRARVGALPSNGPWRPAVEMDGLWFNTLGVETARLYFGLPQEALRFRWKKGAQESLEIKGTRFSVGEDGLFKIRGRSLPQTGIEQLWQDPAQAAGLKGKAVFYRPWPLHLSHSVDWEAQAGLAASLIEPAGLGLESQLGGARGRAVILGILGLAAWLLAGVLLAIRARAWRSAAALKGSTAQGQERAWHARLVQGHWSGAVAWAGPSQRLQGRAFEAWVERWQALLLLDPVREQHCLALPPGCSEAEAAAAFDALRSELKGLRLAWSWGSIKGQALRRLGHEIWRLEGPAVEKAMQNFDLKV